MSTASDEAEDDEPLTAELRRTWRYNMPLAKLLLAIEVLLFVLIVTGVL